MEHAAPIDFGRTQSSLLDKIRDSLDNLGMFWRFPPFHMIFDTGISIYSMKSNFCRIGGRSVGCHIGYCSPVKILIKGRLILKGIENDIPQPEADPQDFPIVLTATSTCWSSLRIAFFTSSLPRSGSAKKATSVTGASRAAAVSESKGVRTMTVRLI